jgi:hypothetical protein
MTRRERLMATVKGEPVDRPPVSFYEINGLEPVDDPDPFNVYSHPSWRPLTELARDRTDRIVMVWVPLRNRPHDPVEDLTTWDTREDEHGSRFETITIRAGRRVLTQRTRRDRDVNTVWTIEHLLKDLDDLQAYLELPEPATGGEPDPARVLEVEAALGDSGIVMLDSADPVCQAAGLFDMGLFTVAAMTEPALFRRLLDRFTPFHHYRTEAVAKALPGRLWRIFGPEYASEPYLPPRLFEDYVVPYDRPMVESIQRAGGFARIHCHGRLRNILDAIAATGCVGLDPIEPPPQGDVSLAYVRERYGKQFVLFGNLEASDLENLPTPAYEQKIRQAIREGTAGRGRGFVLMPSACPYGRVLTEQALRNYTKMVEVVEALG